MRYESKPTKNGNVGVSYSSQREANAQARKMDEDNCRNCSDCSDFKRNPSRFTVVNIGSRNADTTVYWDCLGVTQVVCGCFRGTIQSFTKQVVKTRRDNEHAARYLNLVDKVFELMEV